MKLKIVLSLVSFLTAVVTFAQVGTISGTIRDAATGESLIGATVLIKGTSQGAATDFDGNYTIKGVKAGTYVVDVSYISYTTKSIEKVVVIANQTTNLKLSLESDQKVLGAVEVIATRRTGTEMSVITELKRADQIAVGVSAAQIAKTQDRDAGQILRRVPGVSIVDGRYVVIRGLIDRYNTVLLNDVITPSLEVDKKSFSFDLIPSAMIDRMLVYKSGGADLPGEFAGGVIKVYTKNIPDENFVSVQLQGGYRSGTTLTEQRFNQQGGTAILGFSKSGNLPSAFPETNLSRFSDISLSKSLKNDWSAPSTSISPDLRFNVATGKKFTLGKVQAGNLTTITYSNVWNAYDAERNRYGGFNEQSQSSGKIFHYDDKYTANSVNLGVISNFNFRLSNKTSIDFRNFFNQTGRAETTIRQGYTDDPTDYLNYAYRYEQRSLYSGQVGLTVNSTDRDEFKATLGYGLTKRTEPDYRRVRTYRAYQSTDPFTVYIPAQATTFDAARFFSQLNENSAVVSGNWEHKLGELVDGDQFQNKFKAGFYLDRKQRTFSARWMSYVKASFSNFDESLSNLPIEEIFSPENMGPTGFALDERTNKSDKYDATSTLAAGYVSYSKALTSRLNMILGLRAEYNVIELNSYVGAFPVNVNYPKLSPVPSLNLSYNLTEKQLIRFAYTYSVNRPEFRELAPFNYYDFSNDVNIVGNPDIKIATVNNYDFRWELYPSPSELITVGVFYKQFTNPIERLIYQGGGNSITYGFANAQKATSAGAEIEIRKGLNGWVDNKVLQRFSLLMNLSLIKSKVNVDTSIAENSLQLTNRALQGQSPYLVNAGLYYSDDQNGWQVNFLYNVIGTRLYAVGNAQDNASQYESPRSVLDFNLTKKLGEGFELKAAVADILNQPYRLTQDSNSDGKITAVDESILKYKFGRYFSLGFTYKF